MPRIAVIGAGINGAGIAWELARRGYEVTLFDKGAPGGATSSATTKLIHGGLRYLETFELRLVREALRERAFLLRAIPELVKPLELVLPMFRDSPRSRFMVHAGLRLYDLLAGREKIAPHRAWAPAQLGELAMLRRDTLVAAFSFFDAQVDDRALVERVVSAARRDGCELRSHTSVHRIVREGDFWRVEIGGGSDVRDSRYDGVAVVAGPWMNELLARSQIASKYTLTLVRGSHLVLDRRVAERGFVLQQPDGRIVFVLPWRETSLVGTTEVVHRGPLDRVEASAEEVDYLLAAANAALASRLTRREISSTFAGVRPLVERRRRRRTSRMSREYRIERAAPHLINVFGGKMTTFLALARKVADAMDIEFGERREAKEILF